MTSKNYILFLLVVFNFSTINAQRQSDSLRKRQELYWKQLKEQELKQKEKLAIEERKRKESAVVTYDSKGNKIETIYKNGEKIITKTIKGTPLLNRPFKIDTLNLDSITFKVFKAKNRLQVYHKGKAITAFKCVFGPNWNEQKLQEGDRRTPEGTFKILSIKKHEKWNTFMLLDFPNENAKLIFENAKANGLIPASARIGGAIGIHGIWFNGDNVIDLKHNWTDGCISLKNNDIELLATLVKEGITTITIGK